MIPLDYMLLLTLLNFKCLLQRKVKTSRKFMVSEVFEKRGGFSDMKWGGEAGHDIEE